MKSTYIFLGLAVLGIGAAVFFFIASMGLQRTLGETREAYDALKEKHADLEREFTLLKNSDLAKEVELLTLKLKTAEKDFAASEKEVSRLQSKVNTLEASMAKIKSYVSAIDAVQRVVLGDTGPTRSVVANTDPKVAALKDTQVSTIWEDAKRNINFEQLSWQQQYFGNAVSMMVSRILSILP